ncbi:MAG: DUF4258 domain-containing protein [Nitrospiraceae bacterium]|nr:DUF4258 domain-containing protein [Nitrospiraceae bacterium]
MMIEKIKSAIIKGRINITDHADEELAYDEILDEDLFHSVLYGEVIEDYADDKPFPSCLVYGRDRKGRHIHSVWAYSDEYNIAIVITGYIPETNRWIDYKTRRIKC